MGHPKRSQVKVLEFGLAKVVGPWAAMPEVPKSIFNLRKD
jgi:hypothetical protein